MNLGVVADFDDARGWGHVRGQAGEAWAFHCTAVADGSRTIDVGVRVAFEVAPGHRGAFEAVDVTPVDR